MPSSGRHRPSTCADAVGKPALALQGLLFQVALFIHPAALALEDADGGWSFESGGGGGGGGFDFDFEDGGDWGEGTGMDTPLSQGQDDVSADEQAQAQETGEVEGANDDADPGTDFDPAQCSSDNGDTMAGDDAGATPGGTDDNGSDTGCGSDNQSGGNEGSSDTSSSGSACMNIVGDPIDLSLADKGHVQVDYAARGANPLRLARNYHSNLAAFAARVTMPMGTGWRSSYDRSLQVLGATSVRLHRGNGRTMDFSFNGTAWVSSLPAGVLTQTGAGWQYVNHKNRVESYNAAGQLQTLASGGKPTTLAYDAAGRLQTVSNGFGRTLTFAYDGAGRVGSVTLPGSGTITYAYGTNNNLTSVRFADNSTRQYVYENTSFPNALTGVIDESGRRRLSWGYDTAGRPNHSHYGSGTHAVNISYSGSQVTTTDARGTVRTRSYATVAGRSVLTGLQAAATADSAATGWSFSYDGNGNPTQVTSRTGEVRRYGADGRGRLLSAVRASGSSVQLQATASWHPVFKRRTQFSKGGVTQNTAIDAWGRVTQVSRTGTNGSTAVLQQRSYNAQNLLQSVTDAYGATRSYAYDANGNVSSITNQLGQVKYFSAYNAHGQAGRIDRADGSVVLRSFDTRGRLLSHSLNGVTTMMSYDGAGRLYRKTRADGSWSQRDYDAAGQVYRITNHRGETTNLGRDATGKLTSRVVTAANGSTTSAAYRRYDSRGRLAAVLDAQNNQTRLTYAADARLSTVTDPLNLSYSRQLDLLNRPTVLTQPNTTAMRQAGGAATVSAYLGYDTASGTHQSTTDTVSVPTGYGRDAFNRRVSEAGNDAGSRAVVRNAAGHVTSATDARGVTLAVSRDNLGRVSAVTPPSGTPNSYAYVAGRSDALPAQMTDASGSTTWSYDSAGRLLGKTQTTTGSVGTVTLTRDGLGRVTTMTYPTGMQVGVSYAGDVVSALTVNGSTLLSNISYAPFGQTATGWTWGNGSSYAKALDASGRITSVAFGPFTRSYGYDAAGRITSYTDSGSGTRTLSYDEAGQLIAFSGPNGSFSYAYDTNGNRRSAVQYGVGGSLSYQSGTNRLLSSPRGGYAYNAAGNPTTDGYLSFTYDAFGHLVRMATANDYNVRIFNGQHMRVQSTTWVLDNACQRQEGTPASRMPVRVTTTRDVLRNGTQRPPDCGTSWTRVADVKYVHADDGSLLGEYDFVSGSQQETIWFNGQPVAAMINGTAQARASRRTTPMNRSTSSQVL